MNYTHLGNNSPDASITRKTGQVPVICLLEYVHLVPDKCLQVQILLHLEIIYFSENNFRLFESFANNGLYDKARQVYYLIIISDYPQFVALPHRGPGGPPRHHPPATSAKSILECFKALTLDSGIF